MFSDFSKGSLGTAAAAGGLIRNCTPSSVSLWKLYLVQLNVSRLIEWLKELGLSDHEILANSRGGVFDGQLLHVNFVRGFLGELTGLEFDSPELELLCEKTVTLWDPAHMLQLALLHTLVDHKQIADTKKTLEDFTVWLRKNTIYELLKEVEKKKGKKCRAEDPKILGALRSFAAKIRAPPFLCIVIAPSFQLQSKNDLQVFERSRRDLQKTWGSFCDLMQSEGVTVA
eukprot:sb/3469534/